MNHSATQAIDAHDPPEGDAGGLVRCLRTTRRRSRRSSRYGRHVRLEADLLGDQPAAQRVVRVGDHQDAPAPLVEHLATASSDSYVDCALVLEQDRRLADAAVDEVARPRPRPR